MLDTPVSGTLLNFIMSIKQHKWLHPGLRILVVFQETHLFDSTSFKVLPCCAGLQGMPPMQVSVVLASTIPKSPVCNCKICF